jgi:hypothetical protein
MKKRMFKLTLMAAIIAVSIVYLHGFWSASDPYDPFSRKNNSEIGSLISDSALELLQSASEAFQFMNEIEIAEPSGLISGAALRQVDLAIAKVEDALKTFNEAIANGGTVGNEESRVGKLKTFNYESYTRENGLNQETMSLVAAYLGKGNVLGFYQCHVGNLKKLLHILNRIKKDLSEGRLSENKLLGSLLQQYNSTMMFGNYASLVFYRL